MNAQTRNAKPPARQILAGVTGNILEWYDFAVFGYLAPVISKLFFPAEDPMAGLVNTFGVFAVGYLVRPLGGMLFGVIGDRLGRKRALVCSIIMMAVPTALVGCLPTHASIGLAAPLLLTLLRLFQGISVGGEMIGSMSYLVEVAPREKRGLYGSWSLFSAIAGMLLGSGMQVLLTALLSPESMATWGWRLAFWLGLLIAAAGAWMRLGMPETPDFARAAQSGGVRERPVRDALREAPGRILQVAAMNMTMGTGMYMLFLWMPTYLTSILKPAVPHAYALNTAAMFFLIWMMPLAGWLSDRVGARRVMLGAVIGLAATLMPLFGVIHTGHPAFVFMAQIVLAIWVGALYGVMPAAMGRLFPVSIRYSATGLGYNTAFALFCGTAPMVSTWLIHRTGLTSAPAIYLTVLAVISLPAYWKYPAQPPD